MKKAHWPRIVSKLTKSLHHQLDMYAVAASAAGVGMLAFAPSAGAKIVYTPAHVQIIGNVYLKLNHDGIKDFCSTSSGFSSPGL